MRFRFVRTGNKPVNQLISYDGVDSTTATEALRNCFDFCTQQVRDELEEFLTDSNQKLVTFELDGETVEVRRESK